MAKLLYNYGLTVDSVLPWKQESETNSEMFAFKLLKVVENIKQNGVVAVPNTQKFFKDLYDDRYSNQEQF